MEHLNRDDLPQAHHGRCGQVVGVIVTCAIIGAATAIWAVARWLG